MIHYKGYSFKMFSFINRFSFNVPSLLKINKICLFWVFSRIRRAFPQLVRLINPGIAPCKSKDTLNGKNVNRSTDKVLKKHSIVIQFDYFKLAYIFIKLAYIFIYFSENSSVIEISLFLFFFALEVHFMLTRNFIF